MTRRAARFTEADATRAAKAAKRAGVIVEIGTDGVFRFVPPAQGRPQEPERPVAPVEDIVL